MESVPGGKGSGRRNAQVPMAVLDNNWDQIFKKKPKEDEACDVKQTEQRTEQQSS